ncbi:MAG: flagellar basal body rod protein FlgF [Pseudomonadota bacterium]
MDRLLYISAVGLRHIEQAQTAKANNLANVSTDGFRADFARAMASEPTDELYRSRVYGVYEGAGVDMQQGVLRETGDPTDVAINGDGLFAVVDASGREAYTRNGSFSVNNLGQLVNSQGQVVMGRGGPVALPPFETIMIGGDGSITVKPQGQGAEALVQIDRLKLVNPDPAQIYKGSNGLLYTRDGQPQDVADDVDIRAGFVESSNVNAIAELTDILALARRFELEVRLMNEAQTNDEAASQLLRIG